MPTSSYFLLFCITFSGVVSFVHLQLVDQVHPLLIGALLLVSLLIKYQENMKHIISLILISLIVEAAIFKLLASFFSSGEPPYIVNSYLLTTHLVLDIIVFRILKYRVRFSLQFVKRFQPKKWQYIYTTHADILLYGVYLAFIVVDLLVLGEHLLRNMDYIFGVSEATAKPFWSWNWVYKSYPYAKSILLSCVVTILLATIFVENQRPEQEDDDEDDSDEVIHKTDQQQKP
ncbi:hypothetical protein DS891_08005 [Pseudoalteromonas sp. JC28]|nr:hypothetical protein [Pseudoalteromonas sp. JC28]NSY33538.1 hypothetical protein [Pseudoalteromonas sp. JC28]